MANNTTSNSILVTGATGTVGSHVVRQLAAKHAPIRVGLRTPSKAVQFDGLAVDIVPLDYDDPNTFARAVQGVDQIFLLNDTGPHQLAAVKQLIDAAQAAGVRHIVYLSSLGADEFAERLLVSKWHREIELYLEASGLAYTFVRPDSFMQNFLNYHRPQNNVIYLPMGDGAVAYVDVRDVAAIVVHALVEIEPTNRVYALTGPVSLTTHEAAAAISDVTGVTVNYVDIPPEALTQALTEQGYPDLMIDVMQQMYAIYKAGELAELSGMFEAALGRPPTSFAQFARDHAAEFAPLVSVPVGD